MWNVSTSVIEVFLLCLKMLFHFTNCQLFLAHTVYLFPALLSVMSHLSWTKESKLTVTEADETNRNTSSNMTALDCTF
jgi:hypothetical protein